VNVSMNDMIMFGLIANVVIEEIIDKQTNIDWRQGVAARKSGQFARKGFGNDFDFDLCFYKFVKFREICVSLF
jgi:hypothetical protein